MRKISATAFTLLVLSGISNAQIPTGGNIFFGYSYSHGEVFAGTASGGAGMNGWEGSAEGKYLPWIGVVADFDWHYGGRDFTACIATPCALKPIRVNGSRHTVLFGPRASISIGKYTPFAELLVGVAHQTDAGGGISNSDTTFATAIGGGVDYKLVKGVALRAQGDSIHTHFVGAGHNDLRISIGIVFRF